MTMIHVPKAEFERLASLGLPPARHARAFAAATRINILSMIMRAGSGHIGSSFSSADILSWLFLNEMSQPNTGGDTFFSSKGHDAPAIYATMAAQGLIDFDLIHRLRRLDGLPGHPDVALPGIAANTGSLGMGISKAKGMIQADRLRGEARRVYVLTGDGELQEGQFWESLSSAANVGLHELTVIIDHNKIQSDTWVTEVSDLGDLDAKLAAFGWHVQRCDGHDFDALATCLAAARAETAKPSIIIADTVKGRGVSFMQWTPGVNGGLYQFHSGAPSADNYRAAVTELVAELAAALGDIGPLATVSEPLPVRPTPPTGTQSLIAAYSRALVEEGRRVPGLVALDADLVKDTGLIPFREAFPDRFFECGIAEQDMVSQASGMALRGLLPVAHSFACFLAPRPNEQIFNAATERRKIIYAGSLAGILPAGPGHSHQSVRDIGALGCVPGLVLIQPSCEQEVGMALSWAIHQADSATSTYLRLVSIPCAVPYALPAEYRLQEGRGTVLRDGSDVALIGYGPVILPQAIKAAELLAGRGISARVINMPWLNRFDAAWLEEALQGIGQVVTLDDHLKDGGQGERLLCAAAEAGLTAGRRWQRLGLDDVPGCGLNDEVLAFHGLDAQGIMAAVVE